MSDVHFVLKDSAVKYFSQLCDANGNSLSDKLLPTYTNLKEIILP